MADDKGTSDDGAVARNRQWAVAQETAEVLLDSVLMAAIKQGTAAMNAGQVIPIEQVEQMLGLADPEQSGY